MPAFRKPCRIFTLAALAVAACAAAAPSPESHFGHRMGDDRKVLDWDKVVSYFRLLEQNSDRVQVTDLGRTTEGRPLIVVAIAAPETIRHLDRYRDIQAKLADPRRTTPAQAEPLFAAGKTVVLVTCSIHSNELASTASAIEFAYRLLTEDTPRHRAILENTIFLLMPSLNPDGLDLVTQWYRKTLGTKFEGTDPPELYQKYIGHDNNRDWYIFSQQETRLTVAGVHNVWHPQVVYDVHQQRPYASRMFLPPWLDPIDPNIDPILAQECNLMGVAMATDLTAAGKKGVVINALYDFWTPARHYQAYHGGLRILSESASARLASPIFVRPDQIQTSEPGYDPRQRSWNYLEPWLGGEWRLRDIVDDQLITMESCLYQAAIRRDEMLRSFYRIGQRAAARTAPFAFVVSAAQRDPGATAKLLETLAFGQVEIERAAQPFTADGREYPAGSYVIRMQQPYSSFAKTLLERQTYPDLRLYPGGPPKEPYDATAQTLPLLFGVRVDTIARPFQAETVKASRFSVPARPGLSAADTESWRDVNRIWNAGGTVWRDAGSGDFERHAAPGARPVKRPRIGLYKSWVPVIDEGWTRWLLENFGFAYTSLRNADVQAGDLRTRFDAIVFADASEEVIASGFRRGAMPLEYTGGLGRRGAEALDQFVQAGGTLIFLNRATAYAEQRLGIGVSNVVENLPAREFYSPGSLLNVALDRRNPLALGLPSEITIWSENSPAWDVPAAESVARYPEVHVLASGWLLGERYIAGHSALVEIPRGAGRVILFGFRPQYRAQSYQTFKLFFNSFLLNVW